MTHLFRLMALSWLALSVNWAGVELWAHAAMTATIGFACYFVGDWFDRREERR